MIRFGTPKSRLHYAMIAETADLCNVDINQELA